MDTMTDLIRIKRVSVYMDKMTYLVRIGCLLRGVYVPCIYRMSGGVIVGYSGLCCYVPVQCVRATASSAICSHFLLIRPCQSKDVSAYRYRDTDKAKA